MVWDHTKDLAEFHADDTIYLCHHSIVEGHQIDEAQSDLDDAMLAVIYHVLFLQVP